MRRKSVYPDERSFDEMEKTRIRQSEKIAAPRIDRRCSDAVFVSNVMRTRSYGLGPCAERPSDGNGRPLDERRLFSSRCCFRTDRPLGTSSTKRAQGRPFGRSSFPYISAGRRRAQAHFNGSSTVHRRHHPTRDAHESTP